MRSAAAGLIVFSGNLLAHPGHGAPDAHLHGWGVEHALLIIIVFGVLAFALRKK